MRSVRRLAVSSRTPKAIMDSARGEACTLGIPFVCNHDPETVVFCHHNDGTGGSNKLTGPLTGGYGCSACHDVIDGRSDIVLGYEEKRDLEFYKRRSMIRTLNRLIAKGLVKVSGLQT